MNFKKIKVLNLFILSILSVISHNIYNFLPSILTAIFFPINESIFEHMKIIFTSLLLTGISDYILLKLNNIKYNNFQFQLAITPILSIVIFLSLYLPIHYLIGEYLPLTLFLLLITYIISQIISYKLLKSKHLPFLNKISIFLILLTYLNFIILTFTPNKDDFFYDTYLQIET